MSADDVAEACADALLTACAHGLEPDGPVTIEASRAAAIRTLDVVIERSLREGPKPR